MSRPVVILFARVPRLGLGKRRLAREVGDRAALLFARGNLIRIQHRLRALRGVDRALATAPDHHARLPARGFTRIGQGGGDLGARMGRAFARFPRRPVVLIGADIPGITAGDIRAAFRALRGADAVIGPAPDGGYWLIGMSGRRPGRPFAGVRWSSPEARADTERNFAGRRLARLRLLADVDDAAALAAWRGRGVRPRSR